MDINITKGLNPNTIIEKRMEIAKELIARYRMSVNDLASYFYCSPNLIKKELEKADIKPYERDTERNKQTLEVLKSERDKVILEESERIGRAASLEKHGLWKVPEIQEVDKEKLLGNGRKRLLKVNAILQCGFPETEARKYFGMDKLQMQFLMQEIKDKEIPFGLDVRSARDAFEVTKDMVHNGYDFQTSVRVTGLGASPVDERGVKKQTYEEYINTKNRNRSNSAETNRKKTGAMTMQEKEERMEEAYRLHESGMTEQEIADKFQVDRMSVVNWCRKMKVKHMEEREQPMSRLRNMDESRRNVREEQKQTVLSYLEEHPNASVAEISRNTKLSENQIRGVYRREGLDSSDFEKSTNTERKAASNQSKAAYRRGRKDHFGYGPLAGRTLKNASESDKIFRTAKSLEYEFKNVAGAREHADANKGEMERFFEERYGPAER